MKQEQTDRAARFRQSAWEDRVRLPRPQEPVDQHEEWCEIEEGGTWRKLRFHDYAEIFARPGLYEHLFYWLLRCNSPERVADGIATVRLENVIDGPPLRVIDLGAGNGILGDELRARGANATFGIDILPEARAASLRDRPDAYDAYLAADLMNITPETRAAIERFQPTCLASVAALGFGDVPPRVFMNAASFIPVGGLLAFNIRTEFMSSRYDHGFAELIRRAIATDTIRVELMRRYQHRLNVRGERLFYTAIVATKLARIPDSMLIER